MAYQVLLSRFALAAVALALVLPVAASAAEVRHGEQVGIGAGETVPKNAYLAGGSILSNGNVGGDLVAAGGSVIASGNIGSDLLAAGGNVSVLGAVKDDVRMAGGTLVVAGSVGGDLTAAGGQVTITGSSVGGDAMLAGGTVRLATPVAGSVRISGGSVVIDAPVAGDVEVHAQSLTLGSRAVIRGKLTYEAPKAATMETGASVKGATDFTPIVDVSVGPGAALALLSVWILASLAALLVSSLLLRALFGRYVTAIGAAVVARPWHKLGLGFVILVVVPAVAVVMLLTVVGVPLGIMTLLGYALFLIAAWIFAPIVVGAFIEQWWHKRVPQMRWQTVVYGALAYVVIGLLPFIGPLFKFAVILLALGVMAEKKWEIASEWV